MPRFLGTSVGLIQADMTPEARRAAYASDITYVTNSELGFDYLRDNLAGVSAPRPVRCAAAKWLWAAALPTLGPRNYFRAAAPGCMQAARVRAWLESCWLASRPGPVRARAARRHALQFLRDRRGGLYPH